MFNKRKSSTPAGDEPREQEQVQAQAQAREPRLDLTDGAAVDKRLRELYAQESLYIILTNTIADFERGLSVPMVLMPKEGQRVILIFSAYEKAKNYVTVKRPMTVEGILPIAELKKSDSLHNIDVICANAFALGITAIDFDVDDERGFGCQLAYFMQLNKMSGQGQVVLSQKEMEQVKANNGKFKPRFNAMPIIGFSNPWLLKKERANEIVEAIDEKGIAWAEENPALHEICYGAGITAAKLDEAEKENKPTEELKTLRDELNELIFTRLSKLDRWYTLADKETGELHIQNNAVYLFYTAVFANRLPNNLTLKPFPPSVAELAYLVGNRDVKLVAVTDGPNIMYVMNRSVFGF